MPKAISSLTSASAAVTALKISLSFDPMQQTTFSYNDFFTSRALNGYEGPGSGSSSSSSSTRYDMIRFLASALQAPSATPEAAIYAHTPQLSAAGRLPRRPRRTTPPLHGLSLLSQVGCHHDASFFQCEVCQCQGEEVVPWLLLNVASARGLRMLPRKASRRATAV